MPLPKYVSTCKSKKLLANGIYELVFTKPSNFTFVPGQFVLWQVPNIGDLTDVQPRAYSIASSPEQDELVFIFKLEPNGRAGKWVQQLSVNDELQFEGPLGNLHLHKDAKDQLLLCTSTGIAPFISMLKSTLLHGEIRPIHLVFGVRSQEDVFWQDHLLELQNDYSNFTYSITLSQPKEGWQGAVGRVQVALQQLLSPSSQTVYACGNPVMTKEVKQYCLEQGMQKQGVHIEGFI